MIVYKDILEKLKAAGFNTKRLRSEKLLSESVITRLRNKEPISTASLDKICSLLKCDLSEIIEQRPDDDTHS